MNSRTIRHLGINFLELIVVVAIIGILIAVTLPALDEYVAHSRITRVRADLETIANAIAAYELTTSETYDDTTGTVLRGRYLQKLSEDPWGTPYNFASATDSAGALVFSNGPDKFPNTSDDQILSYKGKLAITGAYWQDGNGDGVVSTSSPSEPRKDLLIITFNRQVKNNPPAWLKAADNFHWSLEPGNDFFATFDTDTTLATLFPDGKTLAFSFTSAPPIGFGFEKTALWMSPNITDTANSAGIVASVSIKIY